MRRALPALILILAAVITGTVAVTWLHNRAAGATYTLTQVEEGLKRHPKDWVGRTVRLDGQVTWQPLACPSGAPDVCDRLYPLTEYSSDGVALSILQTVMVSSVLFIHPEPDPFLDRLRALPAIGRLVPAPQPLRSHGVFRVRLEPAPAGFPCGAVRCYWAVIPDAATS